MILSLDKASDEQLLHAMAGEDMDALGEFYRRHESRVYRYLVTRLNDSATAADLLNDVMLDVWRGAARFAGRSKVTTWMLGIAHHKVLNHWRRQGSRVFTEVDETLEDESESANLEKALSAVQDAERLRECLGKLSDAHREVIHLVFFEELDYAEIATVMGVPEGTVKSRVHHAKNRLQQLLVRSLKV